MALRDGRHPGRRAAVAAAAALAVYVALAQAGDDPQGRLRRLAYAGEADALRADLARMEAGERARLATEVLHSVCAVSRDPRDPGRARLVATVLALLDSGADPRLPAGRDAGSDSVYRAASLLQPEILELFARAGVPLRECQGYRSSLGTLAAAVCDGHASHSLRVFHEPWRYVTTHEAARSAHASAGLVVQNLRRTVAVLLAAGADPMAEDPSSGASAFARACFWGEADMVRAMLAAGADPGRKRARYGTGPDKGPVLYEWDALHVAALRNSRGNAEVVQALLAAGADPAATDDRGMTALDIARAKGHVLVAAALRRG